MEQSLPVYSSDQIQRYFQRIRLPLDQRLSKVDHLTPSEALGFLAQLQKRQLVAVPFENLALHYSEDRRISLHVEDVFEKIVGSGCRGGYCMEVNLLFATVLKTLGFQLYTPGARVWEGQSYGGW
jgi:arylamine N-acetyltransferase